MTFDAVLPTLAQVCEDHPGFEHARKAVAVRDLRGRVRLVLDVDRHALDASSLGQALEASLGAWFEGPVLLKGPTGAADRMPARIAATVLDVAEPWAPSWVDLASGSRTSARPWGKLERHLSKQAWTPSKDGGPPWPLNRSKPAIVTFYSFKGGVGRTTLLAAVAWQLAAQGKRVLVLDLDVEAPGVGSTLGATAARGVLDFLVDHAATGRVDLDDLRGAASSLGDDSARVDVVPAGRLDGTYFEKLARLDFAGSAFFSAQSPPVRTALRDLLAKVASGPARPDYILIDSRAGLHDIAGLSLHDLAHVDVLVSRDDEPSLRGLDLVMEAVGKLRRLHGGASRAVRRFVTVYSMAATDPRSEERERGVATFRRRAFDAFDAHVYADRDDAPGESTEDADHTPFPVGFDAALLRFTELASVKDRLRSEEYTAIVDRITELCTPEHATEERA